MAERIFVLLLVILYRAHLVCAITTEMTSFPGVLEYTLEGNTNNYHLVCIADENGKVEVPFAVRILLETKDGRCLDRAMINGVWRARLLLNSYTRVRDGFLLWCLHGQNEGDIGCNMLYYIADRNGEMGMQSAKDLLDKCDFGRVNGIDGKLWGAYYIGEYEDRDVMAVAVKVGYGMGTNQVFCVNMRDFSGAVTSIRKEYPYVIVSNEIPKYEREIKNSTYYIIKEKGTKAKCR